MYVGRDSYGSDLPYGIISAILYGDIGSFQLDTLLIYFCIKSLTILLDSSIFTSSTDLLFY